ncbi:MAG: permease, partial [Eubacteriales bacterium]|nr:permease [Eubacteriales bacterium]
MAYINEFIGIFLDMSLYMLIGMALTGVLHGVMKKDTVAKHLGKGSRAPALKAALIGVPLPLCSCGVLPTTVYLSQSGATTSAVMA